MPTHTQSEAIQDYLASIGVSGRVKLKPGFYRLTLSGSHRGRLIVELPAMGYEPNLKQFIAQMREPRPMKWQHETSFFSDSELSRIQEMMR